MKIEKRGDEEWLVGAEGEPNDCEECPSEGEWENVCTCHFDGMHLSCGAAAPDGALRIDARWPIAQPEPAPMPAPSFDDSYRMAQEALASVRQLAPVDYDNAMRRVQDALAAAFERGVMAERAKGGEG